MLTSYLCVYWRLSCQDGHMDVTDRGSQTLKHLRSLMKLFVRSGNIPAWQHEALYDGLRVEGERWRSKPRREELRSPPVHFCYSEFLLLYLFSFTRFSPSVASIPCSSSFQPAAPQPRLHHANQMLLFLLHSLWCHSVCISAVFI